MKLNIDFDEFKEYIQNRKNAETLFEKKRKWPLDYRILDGELVFEKNKITVPVVCFICPPSDLLSAYKYEQKQIKLNEIIIILKVL